MSNEENVMATLGTTTPPVVPSAFETEWMAKNPWFDKKGTDVRSVNVRRIADRLHREGYSANSPAIWRELDRELAELGDSGTVCVRTMDFGGALRMMQVGDRVSRLGWNGNKLPGAGDEPRLWICSGDRQVDLPADKFWNPHTRAFAERNGGKADVLPYLLMKTADDKILMGWSASSTDILAADWFIVPETEIEKVRGFDIPGTPSRRIVEEVEYPIEGFGSASIEGEASSYDVAQEGVTRRVWTSNYAPGVYASGDPAAVGTSTLPMD
ncbi:Thoeris anti-defense Tad2 family protein [Aureimonas sp. AU40]|uniref:Thoeris anti-defense Tad2 family protein n=1 Tax=Aureimonas sp. AU40 TaxID=1637747 RepID=UPI0007832082|nr:MW1434 family type I TA system toxin [Aureimonas sp. AU40]